MNKKLRIAISILVFTSALKFCFPVLATEYSVGSASQIAALPNLVPGDVLILANGVWTNQQIIFKGKGTEASPIVMRAQTPGQVVLTGTSVLDISGDYLQVEGLKFFGGTASGSVIEFRNGSNLANHCRLTNVTIQDYSPSDKNTDSKWISLYGTYNRVDHCTLSGKKNLGTTLVVWLDETPDYHLIDHNYFGPRPVLGQNGGETIRIGTSDWVEFSSNTVVEYNLFDQCDGEIEIISNKSVGNHYRYNTFRNCDGLLTLRHGSYCKVYGNFFFGAANKNSGGVRIIGEGHEVFNNYMQDLNGTEYRAAVSLVNGILNSPASGYYQVKKAKIGFNTIVNCKQPFAIGSGKDNEQILPPTETVIADNLIKVKPGYPVVEDYDVTSGITWKTNIYDAEELGISAEPGLQKTTILLEFKNELYRPVQNNISIGGADDLFPEIGKDIDGQTRPQSKRDVGCDQLLNGEITVSPLNKEDVGANYTLTAVGSLPKKIKNHVKVINGVEEIKIVFSEERVRNLSFWGLDGRMISQFKNDGRVLKFDKLSLSGLVIMKVIEDGVAYSFKLIL